MEAHGLAPHDLADLPPFEELLPKEDRNKGHCASEGEEEVSPKSGQPGPKRVEKAEEEAGPASQPTKDAVKGGEDEKEAAEDAPRFEDPRDAIPEQSLLSAKAKALLESLPIDQFVFPPGAKKRRNSTGKDVWTSFWRKRCCKSDGRRVWPLVVVF